MEDEESGVNYVRVPALQPDVSFLSVQRADEEGNCHYWGNFGVLQEAALASQKIILLTEELVDTKVIKSDPNRVPFPGFLVKAVCHVPGGVHPSPMTGYWKRDNDFFTLYHQNSRERDGFLEWLQEWVLKPKEHTDYMEKLGELIETLKIKDKALSVPANYATK
jgi:glutaconate CoA-transferase subunit A